MITKERRTRSEDDIAERDDERSKEHNIVCESTPYTYILYVCNMYTSCMIIHVCIIIQASYCVHKYTRILAGAY